MFLQKDFDGTKYSGTVISSNFDHYGKRIWRVKYNDGDEEGLFDEELRPLLAVDPKLQTERYMFRRQRAMDLFKYYPVLSIRCARMISYSPLTLLPRTSSSPHSSLTSLHSSPHHSPLSVVQY